MYEYVRVHNIRIHNHTMLTDKMIVEIIMSPIPTAELEWKPFAYAMTPTPPREIATAKTSSVRNNNLCSSLRHEHVTQKPNMWRRNVSQKFGKKVLRRLFVHVIVLFVFEQIILAYKLSKKTAVEARNNAIIMKKEADSKNRRSHASRTGSRAD